MTSNRNYSDQSNTGSKQLDIETLTELLGIKCISNQLALTLSFQPHEKRVPLKDIDRD